LHDFTFSSFEHYLLMDKRAKYSWDDLSDEPGPVNNILQVWKDD